MLRALFEFAFIEYPPNDWSCVFRIVPFEKFTYNVEGIILFYFMNFLCETCKKSLSNNRKYCLSCSLTRNPTNHNDGFKCIHRDVFDMLLGKLKGRKKPCNVKSSDLRKQWAKQKGICPYTGWHLKLPKTHLQKLSITPDRASIDRIDSTKGYTKDNIEFVSLMMQYAKNVWSREEVFFFLQSISNCTEEKRIAI